MLSCLRRHSEECAEAVSLQKKNCGGGWRQLALPVCRALLNTSPGAPLLDARGHEI
jgi:hypothetical protein